MKVKNIFLKQKIKELEKTQDYYGKVKETCIVAGLVAFYAKTPDATHEQLAEVEKQALETIETIIKRHNL